MKPRRGESIFTPVAFLDLRRVWTVLVSLLLGPFALWMATLGKLRRRGLAGPGWWFILVAAFALVYALLAAAPWPWEWTAAAYLLLAALSTAAFWKTGVIRFFTWGEAAAERPPAADTLALCALAFYPALFGYGLFRDLGRLRSFSIHLPASVYTEALSFAALYGTPLALLAAWVLWRTGTRPGLRLFLNLWASAFMALAWMATWESLHHAGLRLFGSQTGQPLIFRDVRFEAGFREALRAAFFGAGAWLAASYLAPAPRTLVLLKRTVFLGLPALLGQANLVLLLGEGGYYLAGMREHFHREGHYRAFRLAASLEAARMPRALHLPFVLRDAGDWAYWMGPPAESARWRDRLRRAAGDRPFYSGLREQADWADRRRLEEPDCLPSDTLLLPVPRARAGVSLDSDWYALLGAIGYLRPHWSDFDLKKQLLEVSPDVRLAVPPLAGIPAVAEMLDAFGLPFSACFLDSAGLRRSLREKRVPFFNYQGRWIALVGWDPCRQGYWYHRYPDSLERNPWLRSADREGFFEDHDGAPERGTQAREPHPAHLLAFLSEPDLLRYLHDIGGVALVLGDSAFAPAAERKAAFLVELGDELYQDQGDYEAAAGAYDRARALHGSDYIRARQVYLIRRARFEAGPGYGAEGIFRPPPEAPSEPGDADMVRRIASGAMGQYLLAQWHESAPRFFAGMPGSADSVREIFRTWLRLQPRNPVALDSLASGFAAEERWDSAAVYYKRLLEYHPLGYPYGAYRLAWALFRDGRHAELEPWLRRCEAFGEEARYQLMRAASDWQRGRRRRARAALEKSLKLDKTLAETHAFLHQAAQGDSALTELHGRWRERTEP